jgi:5'-3' exonuclease
MNYTIIKKVRIAKSKLSLNDKKEIKKKSPKKTIKIHNDSDSEDDELFLQRLIKKKSVIPKINKTVIGCKLIEPNSKIDFDPFNIYTNNMEIGKPILLVDLGYTTFYRFNATKTWYKHSHPDEKDEINKADYDWSKNEVFVEKFNQQYLKCLLELAKKFKVPKHNVIMAQDCSSCDNWRNTFSSDYKLPRKEHRQKNGFDGEKIFEIAYNYTFKAIADNYGFKLFKYKNIEADDINAVIAKYYHVNFPNTDVYVVATDKDYLQLSNDKFHLVDFKGNLLNDPKKDKKLKDGKYQLWLKIIQGDKSDNIPPLKIRRDYIRPNIKSNQESYINATKKDAENLAENIDKFLEDIKKDTKIINKKQLKYNQQMMNMDYIPEEYQKKVINDLEKLF